MCRGIARQPQRTATTLWRRCGPRHSARKKQIACMQPSASITLFRATCVNCINHIVSSDMCDLVEHGACRTHISEIYRHSVAQECERHEDLSQSRCNHCLSSSPLVAVVYILISCSSFLTSKFISWLKAREGSGCTKGWLCHLSYLRPHPPFVAAGK